MDLKQKISHTFGVVLALTLIIIVVLFIINGPIQHHQPHPFLSPLKDAISTTGDYFGGIAALAAAYIASLLFTDWRNPHKATFYTNECKTIINYYKELLTNKRKLAILESHVMELIYSKNGLKKINPNILNKDVRIQLDELNNEIVSEVKTLFSLITKISSELSMLTSLTEDHEYLIECINLQTSLTNSYKKIINCNAVNQPYEIFNILQEANKNNYLFVQGTTLIWKIKNLGEV